MQVKNSDNQGEKRIQYKKMWNNVFPYLLMAPVVIYILTILVGPLLYGVVLSFTDKVIGQDAHFAGLKNYISLVRNKEFRQSIGTTFLYTGTSVLFKVILGIGIAVLLNSKIKFLNISRGLILIPWAVPTVVSVLTWKWMFSDVGGVLNTVFRGLGLIQKNIAWLSTPRMAFISIVIVNVWRGAPFIGISALTGLQAVSADIYESAQIDGANAVQRFIYITIPSIKDVLMLSTLVTTIWTFNDFEIIWLLTKGGPINSTQVISTFSYTMGMLKMNTGQAMASSILFMPVMILLVNLVTSKTLGKEESV